MYIGLQNQVYRTPAGLCRHCIGRSMQVLYRPVMQNLGGLMPHIENDTGPAGGLLHYGRSASYCSGTARPASPYSMYITLGRWWNLHRVLIPASVFPTPLLNQGRVLV